jgi:hypothetical protein
LAIWNGKRQVVFPASGRSAVAIFAIYSVSAFCNSQ